VGEPETPIATPLPQRLADLRRRRLPVIVWSLALLLALWLLSGRAQRFEYIGLAEAMTYEISAAAEGRLDVVLVDLYDHVEAGDVVASLDPAVVEAEIQTANATLSRMRAELEKARIELLAARGQNRAGWVSDLRRFQIDEEQRRLDLLALKVDIESDEVEAERLALERERSLPLLETGIMGQMEYEALKLDHEAVERRLTENRVLLEKTEEEYQSARTRRVAFEADLPAVPEAEPLLQPLRAAVQEETLRLQEIQVRRADLVLRSPVSGQVNQVLARAGQSVVPGEPIVTITENAPREIIAYLDESDDRLVSRTERVRLVSVGRPELAAESWVVRVGQSLDPLPARLWTDPARPSYGRAVVIAGVPDLQLAPGERVSVRFLGTR
jgi:multidrug resistance efflux pump